ncbi:hypothetical protein BH11ARM1_BH11ARM1_06060 [soil metagenome]
MNRNALAALAAIMLVPCLAMSQTKPPQGGPGMRGGPGMQQMSPADMQKRMAERQKKTRDELTKDLKLTPDQLKKYDALVKTETAARMKMFGGMGRPGMGGPPKAGAAGPKPGGPGGGDMMKMFQKMRADHMAGMKKILTKDQNAKYEKMEADRMKKRMGGPGMGGPGGMRRGGPPPAGAGK